MNKLKKGLTTLVLILSTVTHWAYAQETETTQIAQSNIQKVELNPHLEKELLCLALNIYHEAGGETVEGKIAVAQVSINRTENGRFPGTICGVVKQKTVWQGATVCQFSWYCTDKGKRIQPLSSPSFRESFEVARKVLIDGIRLDHMREALYFHARSVKPNWGKVKVAQIGNHVFYRDHR